MNGKPPYIISTILDVNIKYHHNVNIAQWMRSRKRKLIKTNESAGLNVSMIPN